MKFKKKVKYKLILPLKMKMTSNNETNRFFRKKFDLSRKIIVDTHGPPDTYPMCLPGFYFHGTQLDTISTFCANLFTGPITVARKTIT